MEEKVETADERCTEETLNEVKEKLRGLAELEKKKNEEDQKKRKREEALELVKDIIRLYPWQRRQPENSPAKKRARKGEAVLEESQVIRMRERIDETRHEMIRFLKEHLPANNMSLCDQLESMETAELIIRFRKNVMPMWRLGLCNVPIKIMFGIARIKVSDLKEKENSVKLFKERLDAVCKEIAEWEPVGVFDGPEYDPARLAGK
jgi:hypothetical protein